MPNDVQLPDLTISGNKVKFQKVAEGWYVAEVRNVQLGAVATSISNYAKVEKPIPEELSGAAVKHLTIGLTVRSKDDLKFEWHSDLEWEINGTAVTLTNVNFTFEKSRGREVKVSVKVNAFVRGTETSPSMTLRGEITKKEKGDWEIGASWRA